MLKKWITFIALKQKYFVIAIAPVSYTHLDVYKRQHPEYPFSDSGFSKIGFFNQIGVKQHIRTVA